MSQTVIKVENLSKKYILGEIGYNTLYHTVQSKVAKLLGKEDPNKQIGSHYQHSNEEFWALKDINFEIKQGERVGIIGRNGAGKSTLLKILSKVTSPSSGSIKIRGRVASLLEVGTGFHPELSGRDNIYLNGTILGMNKREIDKKIDEIIAFAEVEQFVDTPVKRYSSGMYVRLAFAVAAHLDPEILIVDEVLAVGDAAFQKKALGKMEDVSKGDGRTILFVSHNLGAVKNLCNKGILLEHGGIRYIGNMNNTIDKYLILNKDNEIINGEIENAERTSSSIKESLFKWKKIKILDSAGKITNHVKYYEPFDIIFTGYSDKEVNNVLIGLGFVSRLHGYVYVTHQVYNNITNSFIKGYSQFKVKINPNIFTPGIYDIYIAADGKNINDHVPSAIELTIEEISFQDKIKWKKGVQTGFIYYPYKWSYKLKK